MPSNLLYYGDNLEVLRRHVKDESVDLVYLDPPFNSNANYNVLFAEHSGEKAASQIQAFEDTWRWDQESARAFFETVQVGGKIGDAMQAFHTLLGESNMMAYLAMMAPRLLELRRVLKSAGSLYLHCDPTASHYLKIMLDAIFGPTAFVNELIWQRSLPHGNMSKKFGASHDSILFYRKSQDATWNGSFAPHRPEYIRDFYKFHEPDGRQYRLISCINPNPDRPNLTYEWNGVKKVWKYTRERMQAMHDAGLLVYSRTGTPSYKGYLDQMKGTPMQDIWADIPPLMGSAKERLGYPTQKPEALLERIIKASSNDGDVVLDPFCGCGTAIAVAQRLKRRWIGIDITHLAVNLMKHRLLNAFGEEVVSEYEVIGEPTDLGGAKQLAKEDPYQFQWWALGLVGARPVEQKKGADKGIDGRLPFHMGDPTDIHQIILSVKAGKTGRKHVHELRGVMEREGADIGVLISMQEPTRPMREEAASAGMFESPWGTHPRLQLLTVEELLEGKRIDSPPLGQVSQAYKKAPEAKRKSEQLKLGED